MKENVLFVDLFQFDLNHFPSYFNLFQNLFKKNDIKTEDIDFEKEYVKIAEKSISQIYPSLGYMGINPF